MTSTVLSSPVLTSTVLSSSVLTSPVLMSSVLPALLAGLSVAVALARSSPTARLTALAQPRQQDRPGAGARVPERRHPGPAAACALAGAAVALLVGGAAGVALGLVLGVAGPYALARLEPQAVREEREQFAADLPMALDLLAACLAGGAALPAAVVAVASAVPGPCGRRLARVAAALDVGMVPGEAWQALADGGDELAGAAVRALVRSDDGGTPVAEAMARLAVAAREAARARGQERAERAGVLAVGPLGLCFLPAFVLLGVVPVVAGLVGPLLAGL